MSGVNWRGTLAEVVGTFGFVTIGAGAIVAADQANLGAAGLIAVALANGLSLAVMISIFGHISGGVFNPAVTVGLLVGRKIGLTDAMAYIVAQLIGATLAGLFLLLTYNIMGGSVLDAANATSLGTPSIGPEMGIWGAVLLEGGLTLLLVLTVYGTVVDGRGPKLGGFAIGMVVGACILIAGPLTGASLNPARNFGPTLVSMFWDNWWVYWVGPIIGGAIGGLLYSNLFLSNGDD
ncbi:MAG: aquaporin [Chloroflexota bacterium]|nr:aquaporin [Chloroflexota bacterium]